MGNTAPTPTTDRTQDDLSDRELARQLIESKRKRAVQFAEPTTDSVESPADSDSVSLHATDLRSNLMRVQKDRDPLFYYEIIKVVGVGSMGSVAMVKKRDEVIGGSARKNLVRSFRREKQKNVCFQLPIVGDLFRHCFEAFVAIGGNNNAKQSQRSILSNDTIATSFSGDDYASVGSKKASVLYALKSIHLCRVGDQVFVEELKNEIEILKKLDHPYIVRPIETFVHKNKLCIVMELCSGGDLYSRDPYTEDEAARIVGSIISAVSFMHDNHIVHRDIKYENILFANDSPMSEIKLIDFGLSKKYASDSELTEGVGTIYTMAPEVLKGHYTSQADLWSVGVVAYMLLSSQMPFYGSKRSEIVDQIMKCKYDFKGRRWKRVSNQAKELVKDLLVMDPTDRSTADEVKQCMWLNKRHTMTVRGPTPDEADAIIGTLLRYSRYSDLKKLALMVIAHKSTSEEIGILRKVFQSYDVHKDGTIELPQFRVALASYGYPDDQIIRIFEGVDLDGSGKIRYTEFLAATIEVHGAIDEERLAEAFDRLDCDDSGYISAENLRELLGDDFPQERINAIIKQADLTDDNQISYPEFLALWEDGSGTSASGTISPSGSQHSFSNQPETIEKKNLRADSEAESTTLARSNFVEGKKLSERKAKDALQIAAHQASHVLMNAMDEIMEDPTEEMEYTDDLVCEGFRDVPPEITKLDENFRMSEISKGSYAGDSAASSSSGGIEVVLEGSTDNLMRNVNGPAPVLSADI